MFFQWLSTFWWLCDQLWMNVKQLSIVKTLLVVDIPIFLLSKDGDKMSKRFNVVKTKWWFVQKQSINGVLTKPLASTSHRGPFNAVAYASLSRLLGHAEDTVSVFYYPGPQGVMRVNVTTKPIRGSLETCSEKLWRSRIQETQLDLKGRQRDDMHMVCERFNVYRKLQCYNRTQGSCRDDWPGCIEVRSGTNF